jgi:soluble lytic murein transglycosylase-like protein
MLGGKTPGDLAKWQMDNATAPFQAEIDAAQVRINDRALEMHNLRSKKLPITSTLAKHGIMQGTYEAQRRRLLELERANESDQSIIDNAKEKAILERVSMKSGVPRSLLEKALLLENSGANAVSPKGARGRFQIMPGNLLPGEDPTDFETGATAAARVIKDAIALYGYDEDAIFAYYNGGKKAGDAVHAGKPAPFKETRNYLDRAHKIDDPLPSDFKRSSNTISFDPLRIENRVVLLDQNGNQRQDVISSTDFAVPTPRAA